MNGIDLNDVATFVRVAEGGGVTAAARVLGVPKSTVSRALSRLEEKLGVRLVQRTTRALALTDAGRGYYERVHGAMEGVAHATAEVVDMGTEPRGTIRVTAPVDIGQVLLADVITSFGQKYPQVRFEVSLTSRVVDLVAEGFDLAIRASPLGDSSLVARKLGSAHLGLFAAPSYLARRGTPATVAELAKHEFILFRPVALGSMLTLTGPSGEERVPVHGTTTADDLSFVQRMIVAGAGIGVIPLFFVGCQTRLERDGFQRILAEWTVRGAGLAIVSPSNQHEPRRVKLFRDALLAEAKRTGLAR